MATRRAASAPRASEDFDLPRIVGVIKPRATDSSLVDMIKLLPEGIGSGLYQSDQGSREEYGSYATYEKHVAYLASQNCNVMPGDNAGLRGQRGVA